MQIGPVSVVVVELLAVAQPLRPGFWLSTIEVVAEDELSALEKVFNRRSVVVVGALRK